MRRTFNIGVVFVLVLSCWGGALSAMPCPHGCHNVSAPHAHARQDEAQPADHCHSMSPDEESSQESDVSGRAAGDAVRGAGFASTGVEFSGGLHSAGGACDHCMRRGEVPSSSPAERDSAQVTKDGGMVAPAGSQVERASADFVREIIPYGDGPPPLIHRHVLLGVFRI